MKSAVHLLGYIIVAVLGFGVGYSVKDGEGVRPESPEERAQARATSDSKERAKKVGEEETKSAGTKAAPRKANAKPVPAEMAAKVEQDDDVFKVPVGDSVQKGPDDAMVTVVAFSDFQCPFCAKVLPTLDKLEDEYGEDLRIVFKHNPLPFHKEAPLASEYALAAAEQGKFWEMHDKLFENQRALKPNNLKEYAQELGLDLAAIDRYIESGRGKEMISADQKLARQIGATGTPAFFINGEMVSGAQPYPVFEGVVERRMKVAQKAVSDGVPRDRLYETLVAKGRTQPKPRKAPQRQAEAPKEARQDVKLAEGTPSKGGDDPLVTIVEFSDFQCPFCSKVNPTLDEVMKTYGEDVQVRFRNLPLGFHKRAEPAALAALAAGEQGKFWEMHDTLFENQRSLEDEDLEKYAEQIGLDVAKWKEDMKSDALRQRLEADKRAAREYGARGTPTLFVNGVPVRGALPFASMKPVIERELEKAKELVKSGVDRAQVYGEILKREAGKEPKVEVEVGKAPLYGKADAPVKVVVFSDFECPFCGRVNPSIDKLKEEYGDKIAVAFKHFPLSFHKNAKPAAIASLAAHRQGKFWQMHDKLFENQRALTETDLKKYAEEIGLDMEQFEKDLEDPALASWVDEDMSQGREVGVSGTPATFINGKKVEGARPYEDFKAIVDSLLSKS